MKKVVLSLVLAAGFAPAFAAEATPAKVEPKKTEEMAAKPVAPQEKKEGGAVFVAAMCNQCTTPDKKDAKKDATEEQQVKTEQAKPVVTPKALLA